MKDITVTKEYEGPGWAREKEKEIGERYEKNVVVTIIGKDVVLSGNTYPQKETIKAHGFKWNAGKWQHPVKSSNEVIAVIKKLDKDIDLWSDNSKLVAIINED